MCDARESWRLLPLSQCQIQSEFLSSQKVPRPHPVVEGKWEGRDSRECHRATPGLEGCALRSAGSTGSRRPGGWLARMARSGGAGPPGAVGGGLGPAHPEKASCTWHAESSERAFLKQLSNR